MCGCVCVCASVCVYVCASHNELACCYCSRVQRKAHQKTKQQARIPWTNSLHCKAHALRLDPGAWLNCFMCHPAAQSLQAVFNVQINPSGASSTPMQHSHVLNAIQQAEKHKQLTCKLNKDNIQATCTTIINLKRGIIAAGRRLPITYMAAHHKTKTSPVMEAVLAHGTL